MSFGKRRLTCFGGDLVREAAAVAIGAVTILELTAGTTATATLATATLATTIAAITITTIGATAITTTVWATLTASLTASLTLLALATGTTRNVGGLVLALAIIVGRIKPDFITIHQLLLVGDIVSVDEHIIATVRRSNETETLVIGEELNGTTLAHGSKMRTAAKRG